MEIVKKVWGEERVVCNNDKYCGKFLYVKKGYQCSFHYHREKDETFYILSGSVWFKEKAKIDDETGYISGSMLKAGDIKHLLPMTIHRFSAIDEDCVIIEFSTPHKDSDSYRLEISGKIKKIDIPNSEELKKEGFSLQNTRG